MNDIGLAKSGLPIKNGTVVLSVSPFTNSFKYNNANVYNKPIINDIESKYNDRFDDITYYTLGQNNLIGA
jgi:hypothetical protein